LLAIVLLVVKHHILVETTAIRLVSTYCLAKQATRWQLELLLLKVRWLFVKKIACLKTGCLFVTAIDH